MAPQISLECHLCLSLCVFGEGSPAKVSSPLPQVASDTDAAGDHEAAVALDTDEAKENADGQAGHSKVANVSKQDSAREGAPSKARSEAGSTEGESLRRRGSPGERLSQELQKLFAAGGNRSPVLTLPASKLMSIVHMREVYTSLLESASLQELESRKQRLLDAATLAKGLREGCNKAMASLRSNISSKTKAEKRKKDAAAKLEEQGEQEAIQFFT
eukprot:6492749-Amphidinium_carterae.3